MKRSAEQAETEKIRQAIQQAAEHDPELVLRTILESSYWPMSLQSDTGYIRYDDDTQQGHIGVMFSHDGDSWIEVFGTPDPDDMNFIHRFRSGFGGGQSERVRMALIVLAFAIHLDNLHRPQQRNTEP